MRDVATKFLNGRMLFVRALEARNPLNDNLQPRLIEDVQFERTNSCNRTRFKFDDALCMQMADL